MTTQAPTDALRLVPVEPTESMVANALGTLTVPGQVEQTKVMIRQFYHAMLSAAPASPLPEGGGDWSAVRNAFVRHAEAFVKASRYEEASAIADKAAREIQDIMRPLLAAPTGDQL